MLIAVVRDTLSNYSQPFFAACLQAQLVSNGPPFSHNTFSREFLWMAMKGIWKKWEKYARLGKCLGEGHVECHFAVFPQGRKYCRGIGDAWHPQKTKVGSCHNHHTSPAHKLARIVKNQWEPTISPFPTHSHQGPGEFFGWHWSWMAMKGTMKEIVKNKIRKTSRRGQRQVSFCGVSSGRNYSRGIGDAWRPSKPKAGSCHNYHTI